MVREVLWALAVRRCPVTSLLFSVLGTIIWIIFILDFAEKLILAPDRVDSFERNWLTAISLLIPALRLFRVFRALRLLRLARTGRGLRLVRVISSQQATHLRQNPKRNGPNHWFSPFPIS